MLGPLPPVEPTLALQGEEWPSADFSRRGGREKIRAWPSLPCRANIGSTGGKWQSADFSRPPGREKIRAWPCSPCRAIARSTGETPAVGAVFRTYAGGKVALSPLVAPVQTLKNFYNFSKSLQGRDWSLASFSRRSIGMRLVLGPVSPCRTVKGSILAYREQRRGRPSLSTAGSEQTGGWHFFPLVATFDT